MDEPRVSVIIPFFKHKEWLKDAINSVMMQNYSNIEIILINDGSDENIDDLINTNMSIQYVTQENRGPAAARNKGINMATGKYIAFLDSDDLWMENKLFHQIQAMEESGSVWSHTGYIRFYESSPRITVIDVSWFSGNIFPLCLATCPIATPSVIIRRDILINHPALRFAEHMKYGEDHYLWINLSFFSPILLIDIPLTRIRIRGNNAAWKANIQINARAQLWPYIKKIGNTVPLDIRWIYASCFRLSHLLGWCHRITNNETAIEYLSKILYIIPYTITRISKFRHSPNDNRK